MISGWDKSPGPDNDYAIAGPTKRQTLRFIAVILALVVGAALQIALSNPA